MKILGIHSLGHDSSSCLLINGKIIACCEEERYNYKKHTREFPLLAIKDCLKIGKIDEINEIDEISLTYDPSLIKNNSVRNNLPNKNEYEKYIREQLNYNNEIKWYSHHLCHCASVYYTSNFNNSLIYSNDAIGEYKCSMIAQGVGSEINIIHEGNSLPNSLGLFYAAITFYLGWKPNCDEGIVMGLAPYGDNNKIVPNTDKTYKYYFDDMITVKNEFEIEINTKWFSFYKERDTWVSLEFNKIFGESRKHNDKLLEHHKNIACALQNKLQDIVIKQLSLLKQKYNYDNLCISGGVGLNCSLNGCIERSKLFKEIYVMPASGDNGTPLGACFLAYSKNNLLVPNQISYYTGSSFTNEEILFYLNKYKINYERVETPYKKIAQLLNEKKIIGWFQGGAEFGPRALGNRSILTSPFPYEMKDIVNKRVKFREEFRPFAPSISEEDVNDYFDINQLSPYMLMACKVKENMKNKIPAVIHVDNSARIQTVNINNNERFYKLIREFYNLTNIPVLLNTSFNVKGQPIVNTPEEAIKCFLNTNIDVLCIGDYIVKKNIEVYDEKTM